MGAEFQYYSFKKKPTQEEYDTMCEQAAWDYGHAGYSGTLAEAFGPMIEADMHFKSADLAETWLCDNADKWEPATLVSYETPENKKRWALGAWCSS
jgi:hypothetical protein